jgi:glyoxylase I family protein
MFISPQVVLFSRDVERLGAFYKDLGFAEVFRVPTDGEPIHIDLELDGYRIGIASVTSTRDDHGLQPVGEGQRAAEILWTDDVNGSYENLRSGGHPGLHPPHVWLDRLLIAWIADPEGHPVQLVQHLQSD